MTDFSFLTPWLLGIIISAVLAWKFSDRYDNTMILISPMIIGTAITLGILFLIVVPEEIERIEQSRIEQAQKLEEFKMLSCTEKQSYLLENDYTKKQRDYYGIECGTSPIGDWGK